MGDALMPEWLAYANFALNLLIIPLLKVLWDVKMELVRMNQKLESHVESDERRFKRLEDQQDVRMA